MDALEIQNANEQIIRNLKKSIREKRKIIREMLDIVYCLPTCADEFLGKDLYQKAVRHAKL